MGQKLGLGWGAEVGSEEWNWGEWGRRRVERKRPDEAWRTMPQLRLHQTTPCARHTSDPIPPKSSGGSRRNSHIHVCQSSKSG